MKDLLSTLKLGHKLSAVKFRSVDIKVITCYGHFRIIISEKSLEIQIRTVLLLSFV